MYRARHLDTNTVHLKNVQCYWIPTIWSSRLSPSSEDVMWIVLQNRTSDILGVDIKEFMRMRKYRLYQHIRKNIIKRTQKSGVHHMHAGPGPLITICGDRLKPSCSYISFMKIHLR